MDSVPTTAVQASYSRTVSLPENLAALRRSWASLPGAAILESLPCGRSNGRFSIFAADPIRTITITASQESDPFVQLEKAWRPWVDLPPVPDYPFSAAWIGRISYEAGRFTEPSAHWRHYASSGVIARWSLYDTFLIFDNAEDRWSILATDLPAALVGGARPSAAVRLEALGNWLATNNAELPASNGEKDGTASLHSADRIQGEQSRRLIPKSNVLQHPRRPGAWDDTPSDYLQRCRRVLEYIRAGDVFQVNLARRFQMNSNAAPAALYGRLCDANPAEYAAYLAHDGGSPAIISSSPELFLRLTGRDVVTRPIKGTRPRTGNEHHDAAARRELEASIKDRAELNMIVDLERNDLGRVCEFGTVRVACDGEVEALPHVYHRTATVSGRLRPGADAIDLLRATFPGGSITGAPKVRAMQIIHELESVPRAAYCGAIGYVSLSGDMMLNLAIRTMSVNRDGKISFHVGSGIVADSAPEEELAELDAKAVGMLNALGSCDDDEIAQREVGPPASRTSRALDALPTDGAPTHV